MNSASNYTNITSDVFAKEFVLLDAVFSATERFEAGTPVKVKVTHFIPDVGLFYDLVALDRVGDVRIRDVSARKVYEPAPPMPFRPHAISRTGWMDA